MVELFFAPPDKLPKEHLDRPTSTIDVEDVGTEDPTVGTPAGDDTGVKDEDSKLSGHLPEGFPGKAALEEAGQATYAKVRKLIEAGTLEDVKGIGGPTAKKIIAVMEG